MAKYIIDGSTFKSNEHGGVAQLTNAVGVTLDQTQAFPAIANRIYDTYANAKNFLGSAKVVPGLILRVIDDADTYVSLTNFAETKTKSWYNSQTDAEKEKWTPANGAYLIEFDNRAVENSAEQDTLKLTKIGTGSGKSYREGTNISIDASNNITANGYYWDSTKSSFAEGLRNVENSNVASGEYSHAEGKKTKANGKNSHTEGNNTITLGDDSHAEGTSTQTDITSHVTINNTAKTISMSEEYFCLPVGSVVTDGTEFKKIVEVECKQTDVTLPFTYVVHYDTAFTNTPTTLKVVSIAYANSSHAEGSATASGAISHAEGTGIAGGDHAHAEGTNTIASGTSTHAEGVDTQALREGAHAEGSYTTAFGASSHAEGMGTKSNGVYSHAEGQSGDEAGVIIFHDTTNNVWYFESENEGVEVKTGDLFVTETDKNVLYVVDGVEQDELENTHYNVTFKTNPPADVLALHFVTDGAFGNASHTEGLGTITQNDAEHAEGYYNKTNNYYAYPKTDDFVDLGLPSGIKWSKYNLGATTETESGNYYQWASLEPLHVEGTTVNPPASLNTTPYYSQDTYKYTKYNDSDGNDNLTLGGDDAAAHENSDYRIPTHDDYKELYRNCDVVWDLIDGVAGEKFMKKTDHDVYVFLPAAGVVERNKVKLSVSSAQNGVTGYYWLSTQKETPDNKNNADYIIFYLYLGYGENYCGVGGRARSYGFSIRPVIDKKITKSIHSTGIGEDSANRKNAIEVMNTGDVFINGVGNYDGTNPQDAESLQEVINSKQHALEAGQNITIENNTINAEGYVYEPTNSGFAEMFTQDPEDGGQTLVNNASGYFASHAEGYETTASGEYGSHAEGNVTTASGVASHAEGNRTVAEGLCTHAEGTHTQALANNSHAEGGGRQEFPNVANGESSHVEGSFTRTFGKKSHAEGCDTTAVGYASHAEGSGISYTSNSLAEIKDTWCAVGDYSHTEGRTTQTKNIAEHAEGSWNISHATANDANETWQGDAQHTLHSTGNGTVDTPMNALEIMQNADMYLKGVGNYDGVHIKGEVQNTNVMTVQEVLNGVSEWIYVTSSDPYLVDLGLRSGTLWARYNIDVNPKRLTTAQDWYGGYYAWGEVETKNTYTWETYTRHTTDTYDYGTNIKVFKKYIGDDALWDGEGEHADGVLMLDGTDDVATVKHGSKYRMPTTEELNEIIELEHVWVDDYKGIVGLNGWEFTGYNGNKLFIPACGEYTEGSFEGAGSDCLYWTPYLFEDGNEPTGTHAIVVGTYDGENANASLGNFTGVARCDGYPIRCVYTEKVFTMNWIKNYQIRYTTTNGQPITDNSFLNTGVAAFDDELQMYVTEFNSDLTTVPANAFKNCSTLLEIELPYSVTSIENEAFSYCSSLTSITIPNSVTSIGDYAFGTCSSLTSVIIPNSVTSIGDYAFNGCSSLTSITCEATTPPTLVSNTFDGGTKSIPVYVPDESVEAYNNWGGFTNIQPMSARPNNSNSQ